MESYLFDRALIVNLVKRNEVNGLPYENIRCNYIPRVAYVYPERNNQNLNEGHSSRTDCPDLFIPDFTRAKAFIESDRWLGNEEFTLTLTDESGKREVETTRDNKTGKSVDRKKRRKKRRARNAWSHWKCQLIKMVSMSEITINNLSILPTRRSFISLLKIFWDLTNFEIV
ncbi:Bifunctional uridylyltransferase/uridylyl-removing enzyme [Dirofilaria immitis]